MGVFKRRNEALENQKQAEAAMPGAYQSEYKDRINETLDALGGAGSDAARDSLMDEAYQQYRQRNTGYARDAMENAAAGTAALSGGYGSSYAGSAAKQQFQQSMADLDNAMPSVQSEALSRYQARQSGLAQMLSALQGQEAIAQNEYNGSVASAQNWRDYTQSRSQQAQQEVSDFWNNLWNNVKIVGNTLQTAYDVNNGWQQYKDNKIRQTNLDKLNYLERAQEHEANNDHAGALEILKLAGMDESILNGFTGITREKQAEILQDAASLAAAGKPQAAKSLLSVYGMDDVLIDSYDSVTSRLLKSTLDEYKAKLGLNAAYSKTSGSSGSSGTGRGSGGSSKANSSGNDSSTTLFGPSISLDDALKIAKQRDSLKEDDPNRSWYQSLLDGGGYGNTSATDDVLNRVLGYAQKGYNASAITVKLQHEGYSNEEIARIFNRVGITG